MWNKPSKNGLRSKDININFEISIPYPPKDTFFHNKHILNSVRFIDPYDHINPTDNTNNDTHLINSHKEHIREDDKQEGLFYSLIDNTISE